MTAVRGRGAAHSPRLTSLGAAPTGRCRLPSSEQLGPQVASRTPGPAACRGRKVCSAAAGAHVRSVRWACSHVCRVHARARWPAVCTRVSRHAAAPASCPADALPGVACQASCVCVWRPGGPGTRSGSPHAGASSHTLWPVEPPWQEDEGAPAGTPAPSRRARAGPLPSTKPRSGCGTLVTVAGASLGGRRTPPLCPGGASTRFTPCPPQTHLLMDGETEAGWLGAHTGLSPARVVRPHSLKAARTGRKPPCPFSTRATAASAH